MSSELKNSRSDNFRSQESTRSNLTSVRTLPSPKDDPEKGISLSLKDLNCKVAKEPKEVKEDWSLPLPKQVDNLEWILSDSLLSYRNRVEEALLNHLEAMDHCESGHQLEVSRLRAENSMLRGKLGLNDHQSSAEMFQNIGFVPRPKEKALTRTDQKLAILEGSSRKSTGNLLLSKDKPAKNDDLSQGASFTPYGAPKGGKERKGKDGKPIAGGSWQQFCAWVPTGAALQHPQPWKPLPGETSVQANMANTPTNNLGVSENDRGEGEDGDSTSENSGSFVAAKKNKFKILAMWKSSETELKELRKSQTARFGKKRSGGHDPSAVVPAGGEEDAAAFVSEEAEEEAAVFAFGSRGSIAGTCLIHPHSRKRILWDFGSLLMVTYDIFMVPMGLFDLPDGGFLKFMEWTTRLFWTFDMGWSCRTAVILKDGTLNTDGWFILNRYMRTWFFIDIFVVGVDWIEAVMTSFGDAGELISLSRIFRACRAVRLLRLFKMQEVFKTVCERIQSDIVVLGLMIARIFAFVVCFSHVTACAWWGIGARDVGGATWVLQGRYDTAALEAQYLVALHWSLCQFTGGMDEVAPQTTLERFFAVIIWLVAFMATSIILSYLTSKLTQLNMIAGTQSRQVATLRKYLKQNHISSNLALRMQRSAQHALSGDLTVDAVELLPVVSEPLRVEMHFEMYSSVMRTHPFFADYILEGPQVMRRVCHYATGTVLLSHGDVLFSKGESPSTPRMYIVVKGTLEYSFPGGPDIMVSERQCISESVLWTRWSHQGTLTATTDAKLASLDAKTFQEIVDRFKEHDGFDPKVYAADFVAHLNNLANNAGDVSDLTQLRYSQ